MLYFILGAFSALLFLYILDFFEPKKSQMPKRCSAGLMGCKCDETRQKSNKAPTEKDFPPADQFNML